MSEKTKNVLLGVLIVGLVSMTVAYAALSQTLTINGSAKVQARDDSWRVRFVEVSSGAITPSGYAAVANTAALVQTGETQVTTPEVTLKAPGDKVVFTFDVKNYGQINAKLDTFNTIQLGTLTSTSNEDDAAFLSSLKNDINVTLTYADDTAISVGNKLASNETKHLKLTIEYVKRDTEQVLPKGTVTIPGIAATMIYGQDVANAN